MSTSKKRKRPENEQKKAPSISQEYIKSLLKPPTRDLDAEIAALERELAADTGESDHDGGSSDEAEQTDEPLPYQKKGTKLVSKLLLEERIQPLEQSLLPLPGCGMPKEMKSGDTGHKKPKKSKKRTENGSESTKNSKNSASVSNGLSGAVAELLANYEAKSSERIPFYCRVCKFAGISVESLQEHRKEALHIEAVEKEKKVSFCRLCKKQFTSPPQLQEHIKGKGHREMMSSVMTKQSSGGRMYS